MKTLRGLRKYLTALPNDPDRAVAIHEQLYKSIIEAFRHGRHRAIIGVVRKGGKFYAFNKAHGIPGGFREPVKDWVLSKIFRSRKTTFITPGTARYFRNIAYGEYHTLMSLTRYLDSSEYVLAPKTASDKEDITRRQVNSGDEIVRLPDWYFRTRRRLDKIIAVRGKREVSRAIYVHAITAIHNSPYYVMFLIAERLNGRYWLYSKDYKEPETLDGGEYGASDERGGERASSSGQEKGEVRGTSEKRSGGSVSATSDPAGSQAGS